MNPFKNTLRILVVSALLFAGMAGCALLFQGCANGPAVAAYKTDAALITTVNAAMPAWRDYVKGGNGVTQEQIDAVKKGYAAYYAAQMSAKAALTAYLEVQTPENSNAVVQVTASVSQSAVALCALIREFTTK